MIDTCSMPILLAQYLPAIYNVLYLLFSTDTKISEHHSINHYIIFNVK